LKKAFKCAGNIRGPRHYLGGHWFSTKEFVAGAGFSLLLIVLLASPTTGCSSNLFLRQRTTKEADCRQIIANPC
jgi:hypothetical protein